MADLSIRTQAVLDRADLTLEYAATMTWKAIVGLPNSSATVANEIKGAQEWDIQCYGMSSDDLRQMVDKSLYAKFGTPPQMMAMSILSDVQEMVEVLEHDNEKTATQRREEIRQYINRAKWIICERMVDK